MITLPRYNATRMWDGTQYAGASVAAFAKLGVAHGYVLAQLRCSPQD